LRTLEILTCRELAASRKFVYKSAMPREPSPEMLRRFTYVAPDEDARTKHADVNASTLQLAAHLEELLPPGRETALALTALQECRMWANAAIATAKR
jgi:hypothetical protein